MKQISALRRISFFLLVFLAVFAPASARRDRDVTGTEVLDAMKKASSYMMNKVSLHGGFLWVYSEDLSEQFGEIPARKSQVWVQGQGTPAMGELFLDMYETTGDETYLDYARKVADVLVYGQHPEGGWHYFIDFNREGLEEWYRDTASRFIVGWEEFRHYYGNCTYDDDVTQGATAYLLRLYMKTLDPAYLGPLRKALDFMLASQYPNGGWPQRYPLRYEFAHDGLPDYTSFYTLNDGAMNNIIDVLLKAYDLLGDERYLEAAGRGGDFFMIAQGPEGHAAWTDQFDMNLQPATGRTHEPASYQARYTLSTIYELEKLFLFTGDRRYLRPVPMALDWLESVILEIDDRGQPVYADAYDPETNYPIVRDFLDEFTEEGYMKYRYTVDSTVKYVQYPGKLSARQGYEKVRDVKPGMERAMYGELSRGWWRGRRRPDGERIAELLRTADKNGIWIEKCTVHDIGRTMDQNYRAVRQKGSYRYAVKEIDGISTGTFIRNMRAMMNYLKNHQEE